MMRWWLTAAMLLLAGGAATAKKFTNRYDTGEVYQTGRYKKRALDGEVLTYYKNGQLWKRENYRAGHLDGMCFYFYEDYVPEADGTYRPVGQLEAGNYYEMGYRRGREECFYRSGQRAGDHFYSKEPTVWRTWFENGALAFEGDYLDGNGHGTWAYYYPDGAVREVMRLVEGCQDGLQETFYPDGRIRKREVYRDHKMVERMAWDERGTEIVGWRIPAAMTAPEPPASRRDSLYKIRGELQLALNAAVESGDQEAITRADRATDRFLDEHEEDFLDFFITMFDESQRDGEFFEYYATGEKKLLTTRAKGEHHGVQKIFYKDGTVARSIEYKRGVEDGPVRCYYKGGAPEVEGQMARGNRTGVWKFYNPDGSLRSSVDYDKKPE